MGNSNYARGAAFERKLKKELEDEGCIMAIRSAGSHGLFDVVGLRSDGHVILIQAKLGRITKGDRERLEAWVRTAPENTSVYIATPNRKELVG